MTNPQNNLLLIFTRNPELGKCKTRLAKTIGDRAALDVYLFLLEHTFNFTKNLDTKKWVYYSEEIWDNDIWNRGAFTKKLQLGDNLGQRMMNAFEKGFTQDFKKIVIIGSDMYDLSQKDIEDAFERLEDHDVVIGPANDGGYYLLGMKKLIPSLFEKKDWGQDTVLNDTLKQLREENYAVLAEKNDVDLYEDIKDIKAFEPFLKHTNK